MSTASVKVRDLVIEYDSGGYAVRPIDGMDFDASPGELVVLLGPSGLREDVAAVGARRHPAAHRGRRERRRRPRRVAPRFGPVRLSPEDGRLRVPGLQPGAIADSARERRHAAAHGGRPAATRLRARRSSPRTRRPHRAGQAQAVEAVGRPDAARRRRSRSRRRSVGAPRRRAHRQPRLHPGRGHHLAAPRSALGRPVDHRLQPRRPPHPHRRSGHPPRPRLPRGREAAAGPRVRRRPDHLRAGRPGRAGVRDRGRRGRDRPQPCRRQPGVPGHPRGRRLLRRARTAARLPPVGRPRWPPATSG